MAYESNFPMIDIDPPVYASMKTACPLTEINGRLDKPFWEQGTWIEDFHDIQGDALPRPSKRTRAKLLWDDRYLYVGAQLWDDTIWAYQEKRDSIVFFDNDFEVFLSPGESTHRYFELETNARGTLWDLYMEKPNRDGTRRLYAYDVRDIRMATYIDGKLNDPTADNRFWSLEMAIPWDQIRSCGVRECELPGAPEDGDIWRVNFSRVEYQVDVVNGRYEKRRGENGLPLPEDNWVWAPTGRIDIHMPEHWACVRFCTDGKTALPADLPVKRALRRTYYRQAEYRRLNGTWCDDLKTLGGLDEYPKIPILYTTPSLYEVICGKWHIRQDGYLWNDSEADL